MTATQASDLPLVDRMKQEMQRRIAQELTRARESGQPFVILQHEMSLGSLQDFLNCVGEVAKAQDIPPHAVAPHTGASNARSRRSTVCAVIVSF